jgi:STE24 endopeptidase
MSVIIDQNRQQKARRYATIKRILYLVDLVIGAIYLGGIILGGAGVALENALSGVPGAQIGLVAAYYLVLALGYTLLTLPVSVYSGWWLPRRYGISVQTFRSWLRDWLVGNLVGLGFGLVAVEAVYALLLAIPGWWWLAAGALYLLVVVVLANLAPVLLLPLFFKLTPIEPSPLTERLEQIARRAGTQVRGVYRMNLSAKTTAANAALMGLGNTRRIVLGDTLLDRYTPREIEVIFAHELGHHVHGDVPRLVVGQSVVTLVGLYIAALALRAGSATLGYHGIGDVATMPLLALILGAFGVITAPPLNAYSRFIERQADRYALETTGDHAAFVDAMLRLANQNLAEVEPAAWVEAIFYDHPSIGRRVEHANAWAGATTGARGDRAS